MDFEFSDEQELLRDTLRRAFADRAPIAGLRERYGTDHVSVPPSWRHLRELGLCGLLVAEEHGGAGMGMTDAGVVLEELGRALHPAPYLSSCVAAVTLVAACRDRDRARVLPGLADGSTIAAVAWPRGGWGDGPDAWVRDTDGGLRGRVAHVADAPVAHLLVVAGSDDRGATGLWVVALDDPAVTVVSTPTVDGSRTSGTVVLDGVRAHQLAADDVEEALATARDRMAIALSLDGLGAAGRALELAVGYAGQRIQFDQPIGAFQAVQHLCADMLTDLELGRVAAYYALWAADSADAAERHRAATMAKAWASEAFPRIGATAIQVFGGIGFTWEHDIHLFYKRLLTVGQAHGGAAEHLEELARLVL